MRWLLAYALVVAACDSGAPRLTPSPTPPPTPTPSPVPAPAPMPIELIHNVPNVTVRVTSTVRNESILPGHLIDQDMKTAWNSRTGRMVGSWIEVRAPGSRIHVVKLTVGFTAEGPRGENYFTMNPRIVKLAVDSPIDHDRVVTLDPDSREMQFVPLDGVEWVRLTIVELELGTRRAWREVAISELAAYGLPPAGWQPGAVNTPDVEVGVLRATYCPDIAKASRTRKRLASDCSELKDEAEREDCLDDDPGGLPDCRENPLEVRGLARPWPQPMYGCEQYDKTFGPSTCSVTLETSRSMTLAFRTYAPDPVPVPPTAYLADVVKGGPSELVLRASHGEPTPDDAVVICNANPIACTAAEPASTALSHPPDFR